MAQYTFARSHPASAGHIPHGPVSSTPVRSACLLRGTERKMCPIHDIPTFSILQPILIYTMIENSIPWHNWRDESLPKPTRPNGLVMVYHYLLKLLQHESPHHSTSVTCVCYLPLDVLPCSSAPVFGRENYLYFEFCTDEKPEDLLGENTTVES